MEQFVDHSDHKFMDTDETTPWERFVSLLVAFGNAVAAFFRAIWAPSDYMPRLYSPTNPVYFTALKRDPATIVTTLLTDEKRAAQASGAAHQTSNNTDEERTTNVISPIKSKQRELETVSIRSFVEKRCPSMFKDYVPSWWLRSGHTNTIYCVLGDFTKKDLVEYERSLVRLPDGGTIGLDMTPPSWERTLDPKTPIIVALHGLSGGSFESYIRDILSTACAPKEAGGLGYRACVMNFRGCGGVPLTTAQLYSGAHLDDFRSTLFYLRQQYPEAPLLGIGFSLGANVLLRYVEEEGDQCRLRSACVLGCPWDLSLNSDRLEKRWLYRNIYAKAMGGNLLYLIRTHLETLNKLAPTEATPYIARLLEMRAPTLKDYDHHVTRFMGGSAPIFPLSSADEYYSVSSGHHLVHQIKVPFLALNASDDPIVAETPLDDIARSTHVVQLVTPFGGHLGWFEGGTFGGLNRFGGPPPRWVRKPVLEWMQATGEDLGSEWDLKAREPVEARNGFTMEEGRETVGYKLLVKAKKAQPQGTEARIQAVGGAA